jgi:hypothetical protein
MGNVEWAVDVLPNGQYIIIISHIYTEEYRIMPEHRVGKGIGSFGLPYEEVIQYGVIEVDDDGNFLSGKKRLPFKPWGSDNPPPPFLRQHPE